MRTNFKTKARALVSAAALSVAMMVGASAPANAVILDFAAFIDGGFGEKAVETNISVNGVLLRAYGSNTTVRDFGATGGFTSPYAYLDSGTAGIGVCQNIDAFKQCTPTNDDNVKGANSNEILSLSFFEDVQITRAFFRDRDHKTVFPVEVGVGPALINFSVNGGAISANTFAGVLTPFGSLLNGVAVATLLAGQTIDFGYNNTQFYLSGLELSGKPGGSIPVVPLPASVYLFGTGLLGIGFLARRRRKKNQDELKFA